MKPARVLIDNQVKSAACEPVEPDRILADAPLRDAYSRAVILAIVCDPAPRAGPGDGNSIVAVAVNANGRRRQLAENDVGPEAEIVLLRWGELRRRAVIHVNDGSRYAANGQTVFCSSTPVVTSLIS